jgi:hypothetical protein
MRIQSYNSIPPGFGISVNLPRRILISNLYGRPINIFVISNNIIPPENNQRNNRHDIRQGPRRRSRQ